VSTAIVPRVGRSVSSESSSGSGAGNVSAVMPAAVGPLVTGLLAALGFWLRDVRQRHNREQAYSRAVARAREQVSFIEDWLRAYRSLLRRRCWRKRVSARLPICTGRTPW
jgi:hypothetical protein